VLAYEFGHVYLLSILTQF